MEIITAEYYPGGPEQTKDFHKVFAYSNRNSGLSLYYRIIDSGSAKRSWEYVGRLRDEVNEFNFHYGKNRGQGIQFKAIGSGTGIPAVFRGVTLVHSVEGIEG